MTAAELKAYFLAEYDAATSLSAPAWEDSEISSFLNIAQDSIVSELFKAGELGRLSELITTKEVTCSAHGEISNAYYIELSDIDSTGFYFYYLDSRTYIDVKSNPTILDEWLPNEMVDRLNAHKFFVTAFNKPWLRYPKIYVDTINDDIPRFIILVDGYTDSIRRAEITYLKKPNRISITGATTTDLNESIHQTIAALAVEQAVKSIKIAKISNQ